jgi:large subunit ribosomal protein L30
MAGKLRVTLVKSPISHTSATRGTVRALGLHRLGETVEVPDNPQTRGMARAIRFLVRTEEVSMAPVGAERGKKKEPSAPAQGGVDEPTAGDRSPAARRRRPGPKQEESTA